MELSKIFKQSIIYYVKFTRLLNRLTTHAFSYLEDFSYQPLNCIYFDDNIIESLNQHGNRIQETQIRDLCRLSTDESKTFLDVSFHSYVHSYSETNNLYKKFTYSLINTQQFQIIQNLFMLVATNGHVGMLQCLIHFSAEINGKGESALSIATQYDKPDVLEILIDYGANINSQDFDGKSALIDACINSLDSFYILLEYGVDVNVQQSDGTFALMNLAYHNKYDEIATILQNGANVNL